MDAHWVRAVVEDNVHVGDALTEVGLIKRLMLCFVRRERFFTLKVSTPRSMSVSNLVAYHFLASGLVMSTTPSPGCHKSHLSVVLSKLGASTRMGNYSLPWCAVLSFD